MLRRFFTRGTLVLTFLLATVLPAVFLARSPQSRCARQVDARARQQAGRMALLGRRRVEHALLAARPDQRRQLRLAAGRVAVERRRSSATTSTIARRRSIANGRALHRRDDAPQGVRASIPATGETLWQWALDEGIRWQKAPRQFAGRGLAYWTDGTERARRSSSRPAITSRRSTRRPARAIPKFGKDGVVDLMEGLGLPARAARRRRLRTRSMISEAAPARKAKPGEKWDPVDEDRRRRHDRHRSGARTDRQQLAGDRRRRRDRRRQLGDSRLLPAPQAQHSRLRSRLRRAHRQAALEVQPHSAAGRVRRRHVEERIEGRHRRRRQERPVGARTRPIPSLASSTSRSACRSPTNTAAIVRATICSATASSRST